MRFGFGSGGRALLSLGLAFAVVVGVGSCGSGGGDGAAKKDPKAARAELEKSKIENDLGVVEKEIEGGVGDIGDTLASLEKLRLRAEEYGIAALVSRIEADVRKVPESHGRLVARVHKELFDEVKKKLDAGQVAEALKALYGQRASYLANSAHYKEIVDERARLRRMARAAEVFDHVKSRLSELERAEEFERALSLLRAFALIDAFKQSPQAKEVEKLLEELRPKAEAAAKKRASEASITWLPLFRAEPDDLSKNWELEEHSTVNVDGRELVFKNDTDDYLYIRAGRSSWEDYLLDVEFKVAKGCFFVNVRGAVAGSEEEGQTITFAPNLLVCLKGGAPDEFDRYNDVAADRWTRLRIEVRGPTQSMAALFLDPRKKLELYQPKSPKGPFEIRLGPKSEVRFKAIWAKVLKPPGA